MHVEIGYGYKTSLGGVIYNLFFVYRASYPKIDLPAEEPQQRHPDKYMVVLQMLGTSLFFQKKNCITEL